MGAPVANAVRYKRGRIATADWKAEFVSDGVVRKCDDALTFILLWTDDEVRSYCQRKGWKLTRVMTDLDRAAEQPLVRAVLAAFPGAIIKAFRPPSIDGCDHLSASQGDGSGELD